jgi:hypothetical protein
MVAEEEVWATTYQRAVRTDERASQTGKNRAINDEGYMEAEIQKGGYLGFEQARMAVGAFPRRWLFRCWIAVESCCRSLAVRCQGGGCGKDTPPWRWAEEDFTEAGEDAGECVCRAECSAGCGVN